MLHRIFKLHYITTLFKFVIWKHNNSSQKSFTKHILAIFSEQILFSVSALRQMLFYMLGYHSEQKSQNLPNAYNITLRPLRVSHSVTCSMW